MGEIRAWEKLDRVMGDDCSIVPVPLEPGTKRPMKATSLSPVVLFSTDHSIDKRWSMEKCSSYPWDEVDCDLGILISGDIAVMDFDTKTDFEWFQKKFDINAKDYNIIESADKHTGGHIYVKRGDYFKNVAKGGGDLWLNEDKSDNLKIDLKRQSKTLTPSVVKVPMGGGDNDKKRWVNDKRDSVLSIMPDNVIDYLKTHEVVMPIGNKIVNKKTLQLNILNTIPKTYDFQGGEWRKIVCELMVSSHSYDEIYDWSKTLKQSKNGAVPHAKYLKDYMDSVDITCIDREVFMIYHICKKEAEVAYHKVVSGYINNNTTKSFDLTFLKFALNHSSGRYTEKKVFIQRYYNRFFAYTTGQKHDSVLQKNYHDDGRVNTIVEKDLVKFHAHCSVMTQLELDAKAKPTSKFWFNETSNTFEKVEFKPYGIINHKYDPNIYNSFTGYAMKYVPNFDDKSCDRGGDFLNNHLREVLNGGRAYSYDYSRKWLYNIICKGERNTVSWVLYSAGFGSGKGKWVHNFTKHCLGIEKITTSNAFNKMLSSQFTEGWDDKVLVIFEEMPEYSHKNKESWDTMKSKTEEEYGQKENKHKGATIGEHHFSTIMITNHSNAVCPDFATRRANLQEVSEDYIGDTEYMGNLHRYATDYSCWENFVHRYLIADYDSFKNMDTNSIAKCIPQTPYRDRVLKSKTNNMLLFFGDLLYNNTSFFNEIEEEKGQDPHAHLYGKRIASEELWFAYQDFASRNNLSGWIDNEIKFKNELEKQLHENLQLVNVKSKDEIEKWNEKKHKGSILQKVRMNAGMYILMTEKIIKTMLRSIPREDINKSVVCVETDIISGFYEGEPPSNSLDL